MEVAAVAADVVNVMGLAAVAADVENVMGLAAMAADVVNIMGIAAVAADVVNVMGLAAMAADASDPLCREFRTRTPSLIFRHLPPNSAESATPLKPGALFISAHLFHRRCQRPPKGLAKG